MFRQHVQMFFVTFKISFEQRKYKNKSFMAFFIFIASTRKFGKFFTTFDKLFNKIF